METDSSTLRVIQTCGHYLPKTLSCAYFFHKSTLENQYYSLWGRTWSTRQLWDSEALNEISLLCHEYQVAVVVQSLSHVWLFATPWATARFLCLPLSPRVCSNSRPLSRWCHLTISSSALGFSFCLHSLPEWGSFSMSWLSASGGQSIGASASSSVLPMSIQGWFPLELGDHQLK